MMVGFRHWYRQRTRRQATLIRWGVPLLLALIAVQIDWFYRDHDGIATPEQARSLFIRVGLLLVISMALKAALTRSWTVQDIGIVFTIIGAAGLLVRLLARYGPQPVPEWERDYVHSFLEVGAYILMIGLILGAFARCRRWYRRWHYGKPNFNRRSGIDRRHPPT